MKTLVEFRVDERYASLLFAPKEGKRLGDSVRKVVICVKDPRYERVGVLQAQLRQERGEPFFYGWAVRHKYSASELACAQVFHVVVRRRFEPAGEECGTSYDETAACRECGTGARQTGPLLLPERSIPRSVDFAQTIAGEVIASRRVTSLFIEHGVSGARFEPVRHPGRAGVKLGDWCQLHVGSAAAEIVPPTSIGIGPFDADPLGEYRCEVEGHLLGLNLLSEVSIMATTHGGPDVMRSRQSIGVRRGLLRPRPLLLVTPKVRDLVRAAGLKGLDFSVAHVVP